MAMPKKFLTSKKLIQEEIEKLEPNTKLPSERELVERLGFSRPTIQRSLLELENEGFIYRLPRQGWFVATKKMYKSLLKLEGFTQEILHSGNTPSTKLLSFEIIPASEPLAEFLSIPQGSDVYSFIRLRMKNGVPIIMDYSYFAPFAVENIAADVLTKSIYQYIENVKGLKIHMAKIKLDAVLPDEFICRNLEISINDPVLVMEKVAFLADGRPFEYTISYQNPKKYVLEIQSFC